MRRVAIGALANLGHPEDLQLLRDAKRRAPWYDKGTYRKAIRKLKRAQSKGA